MVSMYSSLGKVEVNSMARSNLKCNNRKGRLHRALRQSPIVSTGFRRLAFSTEFTGAQAPLLRLKLESAPGFLCIALPCLTSLRRNVGCMEEKPEDITPYE